MTLPRTNPLPHNPWPTFALCSLSLFLVLLDTTVFSVTFTAMFFGFFFMTRVWGYALPKPGLAVTPGPLMVIPVAIIAGRRAARIGHRPPLVMGGIIYALGAAWIHAMAGPTANFLRDWLPGMLLGGTGVGLLIPSLTAAAVFGLPPQRFGVGSAVTSRSARWAHSDGRVPGSFPSPDRRRPGDGPALLADRYPTRAPERLSHTAGRPSLYKTLRVRQTRFTRRINP